MKKNDIILAAVIILFAMLFSLAQFLTGNERGSLVTITVDGKLYGTYSLDEEQDIEIDTSLGHNRIRIKDGKVFMLEADCPDGYCKKQGKIVMEKETIVCLPHKLIVEIQTTDDTDNADNDYDILIR